MAFVVLEPRDIFDKACIGYARRGAERVLVYSVDKVLMALVADGMDYGDAVEFFEYNTVWPQGGDVEWPVFVEDREEFVLQELIDEENQSIITVSG